MEAVSEYPITPLRGPSPGAKPDEREMWAALLRGERPRDSGGRLGIPEKRIIAICHKWSDRGLYDYGVSADIGWIDWGNRDVDASTLDPFQHVQDRTNTGTAERGSGV